jgi:hypothetical protein
MSSVRFRTCQPLRKAGNVVLPFHFQRMTAFVCAMLFAPVFWTECLRPGRSHMGTKRRSWNTSAIAFAKPSG